MGISCSYVHFHFICKSTYWGYRHNSAVANTEDRGDLLKMRKTKFWICNCCLQIQPPKMFMFQVKWICWCKEYAGAKHFCLNTRKMGTWTCWQCNSPASEAWMAPSVLHSSPHSPLSHNKDRSSYIPPTPSQGHSFSCQSHRPSSYCLCLLQEQPPAISIIFIIMT